MKKLLLIAAVLGVVALVAKKARGDRDEWHGLTEAEARERLQQRFPNVIPEERRDAMADQIVGRMRERGVLADDGTEETVAEDAAEEIIDLTDEAVAEAESTPV